MNSIDGPFLKSSTLIYRTRDSPKGCLFSLYPFGVGKRADRGLVGGVVLKKVYRRCIEEALMSASARGGHNRHAG